MITVYHAVSPTFGVGEPPNWPEEYEEVARVDTNDLDVAYEKTNHIDKPWWENEGVGRVEGDHRSTSVGDVLVDSAGRAWRVENTGFSALGKRLASGATPIGERLSETVAKKLRQIGKAGGQGKAVSDLGDAHRLIDAAEREIRYGLDAPMIADRLSNAKAILDEVVMSLESGKEWRGTS